MSVVFAFCAHFPTFLNNKRKFSHHVNACMSFTVKHTCVRVVSHAGTVPSSSSVSAHITAVTRDTGDLYTRRLTLCRAHPPSPPPTPHLPGARASVRREPRESEPRVKSDSEVLSSGEASPGEAEPSGAALQTPGGRSVGDEAGGGEGC